MNTVIRAALLAILFSVAAHGPALAANYATVCLEYITLRDGSVMCVNEVADLGEGWNCCSTSNNKCINDANVVTYNNSDGSTTTVVHCGGGYYPVFCQGSSIGLICSTTN